MRHLSPHAQGLIAINTAGVVFGSAALFGELEVSPFWITSMRASFAAVTLLGIGTWKGRSWKEGIGMPPRNLWPWLLLSGFILALHWLAFFASVQMSGVAVATLTFASFPLFTVLIEAAAHRRKPSFLALGARGTIAIACLGQAQQ